MTIQTAKIYYTKTDEAPALATYSFLPIVRKFTDSADIEIESKDISLASRILSLFNDRLTAEQKEEDALGFLGDLVKQPEANIIKLPNISASVPQLSAAITELQDKGYDIPDYPRQVNTEEEKAIQSRYAKVLGSAVNPVLREGNSDRRVAQPVKDFAQENPHKLGEWDKNSKSHVAHMTDGDFYGSEKSVVLDEADDVKIQLKSKSGTTHVLKDSTVLKKGEVIDASVLSKSNLIAFLEDQVKDAKDKGVLFSVHLKATMMKVSDPIIFGHVVKVFYKEIINQYVEELNEIGFNPNNGIGDLYNKLDQLDSEKAKEIKSSIEDLYTDKPDLAMVDSHQEITNLHVPSNVIIDASMPAAFKSSGKMWNKNDELQDMKAIIPDRSYAGIYQSVIDYCKTHGAFDPATMGNVCNVGLMAQKAEEYGSHDKTFEIPEAGVVEVVNTMGEVIISHHVEKGDIWRMCQTKDLPIQDWVKLAVTRAKQTGSPAVFWLDENRAHDANLREKVNTYLKHHDTTGLDIKIMNPMDAMDYTLDRVKAGKNTVSVTGNVLRDYLTDLFPILELNTSAKMLSIVPLLSGGGLYETGAGGSAPKHVQQFLKEGHLRWDSLGEFLALAVSLEDIAEKTDNGKARIIAEALNYANSQYLKQDKSPSRKVNEPDNRSTHFYIAKFWAQALAKQDKDEDLKLKFETVYRRLNESEAEILQEFIDAQGQPVDIKGYYKPDEKLVTQQMRISKTLNRIIDA
ncbi:NADP-dependent isocitrate dehydrogenase [Mesohalobacter halotolerans]|uniref:Isocitrate dehydrogenase [NADP] n=1 Tax=Mesohalobacter halotolerans TaxID=1883405 RepID=A0A4U5TNM3_9FLAO|nr:NADP-dependent isocitrate dehydrogenase [Mesohalobacter halotolerans]MBS3738334.1 NADP-dependent isocitrate dehydrogenase [Psychroflexus sp.]TKS55607.1 NADP-dependent isocitrate dehydrogenase [Mesohalobacter halotolerans]